MKLIKMTAYVALVALVMAACAGNDNKESANTLKDAYKGKFFIGTALDSGQIVGAKAGDIEVVKKHFNSIVAENCMKSGPMQPREGEFDFYLSDKFVEFGEQNNMHIVGHTLIWHSQAPRWFFTDEEGNNVTPEVLIERMRNHIFAVMGRYKGRVHGWDVVNEAILDNGSWRRSRFYQILGEDFMRIAFELAHEADPNAELYYNDYNMANPRKREGVVNMVKKLQEQGVKIDGIGMQGHVGLTSPTLEEFENSILAYSELGVKVMITEFDVTVLPAPWDMSAEISARHDYQEILNPYTDGLPDSVSTVFDNRYLDFFNLFLKHQDKISRVTMWGVNDAQSWKNDFPVRGRTDYPLLFDRDNQPKNVVQVLIDAARNYKPQEKVISSR